MNTDRREKLKHKIQVASAKRRVDSILSNLKKVLHLQGDILTLRPTSCEQAVKIRAEVYELLMTSGNKVLHHFNSEISLIDFVQSLLLEWGDEEIMIGELGDADYVPLIVCPAHLTVHNLLQLFEVLGKNILLRGLKTGINLIMEFDHLSRGDVYTVTIGKKGGGQI